jgi:hypothetical protein
VERIRARYEARLAQQMPLDAFRELPEATRDACRRFWSERAWSEYSALPTQAQVLLGLVSSGAPFSDVAALTGIIEDEAFHTALSVRVAEAFGGYLSEVPPHLDFNPRRLASLHDIPLEAWLVAGGCIAETTSRALIRARLARTRHSQLRSIVARTLEDENIHVAFNWAAARRVLGEASEQTRRRIAQLARPTLLSASERQRGIGLSPIDRAAEQRIRDRVAEAGLGACAYEEEANVLNLCIEQEILPQLRRLGIPL